MLEVNIKKAGYKNKAVLRNISFSIPEKSFTAVIGRNGSGKSTLLSVLSGLAYYDGRVTVDSKELRELNGRERAARISLMLQQLRRPHITVRELVAFGRSPYLGIGKKLGENDRQIIEMSAKKADVSEIFDSYADEISGGELRRAYFAMLLAQDTDVVLLDESTAFMDVDYESKFFALAKSLSAEKTVISVIHNLDLAIKYADNVLLLDKGEKVFFGGVEDLLSHELIEKHFSVKRYVTDGKIFFA